MNPRDRNTGAIEIIDVEHHEVHTGANFRAQANGTDITSLALAFRVKPDQTKQPHLIFAWTTLSSGYLQLIEGCSWTAESGTVVVPKNSNRNFTTESILQNDKAGEGSWADNGILKDPSSISGGTVISDKRDYHNDTFLAAPGGGGSRREEIVLKPGETYALVWTSTDGSKSAQIWMEWYEHSPKY